MKLLRERGKRLEDESAKNPSRFPAQSIDVTRLLTVVSFVSQVRTKSGKIWKYNPQSLVSELGKLLHSNVAETTLKPKSAAH